MLKAVRLYLWGALCRAIRGSLNSALNWAGIVGVGAVGGILEYRGSVMSDPHTALGVVEWTAIYTATAWTIIFTVRFLLIAPFQMWREQKDRADKLEGLRQVANEASRPPSFDIGFEYIPLDDAIEEKGSYYLLSDKHHKPLRIWVENIEGCALESCRVVIEKFEPDSPVRTGAMLLPDNRGSEDENTAYFDLAATERRFFNFIDLDVSLGYPPDTTYEKYGYTRPGRETWYSFKLRTDQEGKGFAAYLHNARLEAGKQYFATIVVHGKNANSRRMDITIDVLDKGKLRVAEAESTASYRKEVSYAKQN